MSSYLKMKCTRYVRQVSNGYARSKYSYLAMQQDLLESLMAAQWRESSVDVAKVSTVVNQITRTDAQMGEDGAILVPSTYTAFLDDAYDAFKQGGDAVLENGTMCGYAGMVAYRFTIPASMGSNSGTNRPLLDSLRIPIQASRYLRSGLRVVVAISNSEGAEPPADWATLRGDVGTVDAVDPASIDGGKFAVVAVSSSQSSDVEGVASWGFLGQPGATMLTESNALSADFTADVDWAQDSSDNWPDVAFVWVFLSIEDYLDHWTQYDAKAPRYYSIEGSATIVASAARAISDTDNLENTGDAGVPSLPTRNWKSGGLIGSWPADIASPNENGIFSSASIEAYGNFGVAQGLSILQNNNGATHAANFMAVTTAAAEAMSAADPATSEYANTTSMWEHRPIAENGMIAGFRYGRHRDKGLLLYSMVGAVTNPSETDRNGGTWSAQAGLMVGYAAIAAPAHPAWRPDVKPWTRIRLRRDDTLTYPNMYTSGDFSLVIWRTRSAAAMGVFAGAALAALASNRAFFTGAKDAITGTIEGDGTATSGVALTAEADLVAVHPLNFGDVWDVGGRLTTPGETMEIPLDKSVDPGDILIIVPRGDGVQQDTSAAVVSGVLSCCSITSDGGSGYQYPGTANISGWRGYVDFAY